MIVVDEKEELKYSRENQLIANFQVNQTLTCSAIRI
jgi:hypothetical protein